MENGQSAVSFNTIEKLSEMENLSQGSPKKKNKGKFSEQSSSSVSSEIKE
jgi:hypothetical protein